MVSIFGRDAEDDVPMQPDGKIDLDKMAQRVQGLFKLTKFYDHINFTPEQRFAITKSTIELTDLSGSSSLAENRSSRKNMFEDSM